jgi:microcystin-dependent protein
MAIALFKKTAITGGSNAALDGISHSFGGPGSRALLTGDLCKVMYSGVSYEYEYDSSSTDSEVSPGVIKPDSNTGAGRWLLRIAYNLNLPRSGGIMTGNITFANPGDGAVFNDGSKIISAYPGMISFWPKSTPPAGWLVRDGSAISRTAYVELYAVIGTSYGVGDGNTTFNFPDDRMRVIAGYKSGDATFGTFGALIGESSHLLTAAESGVPAHIHAQTGLTVGNGGNNYGLTGSGANSPGVAQKNTAANTAADASSAHNNIQPTRVYLPIIKY